MSPTSLVDLCEGLGNREASANPKRTSTDRCRRPGRSVGAVAITDGDPGPRRIELPESIRGVDRNRAARRSAVSGRVPKPQIRDRSIT